MTEKWNEDTDYYLILGIEHDASDAEIKKAYKKQALKFHPDRNAGNIEESTRIFQLVEHAYTVLTNPLEKSFYDERFEENNQNFFSRFTSKIGSTKSKEDDDAFYAENNEYFKKIAKDEKFERAPLFGNADSKWEQVDDFYSFWSNFTTRKDFSSAEKYLLDKAPNIQIRRQWTKANAKLRSEAQSKYTGEILNRVEECRKNDPRVQQRNEEKQRMKFEKQEEERKRKEKKTKQVIEELDKYKDQEDNYNPDDHVYLQEFEEDENYVWECEYCNRSMKDERTFRTHCRTNKHMKNVSREREEFFRNPDNYKHNAFLYVILGLSEAEIKQYGDPSIDTNNFSEQAEETTNKPKRGDSMKIEVTEEEEKENQKSNKQEKEGDDENEEMEKEDPDEDIDKFFRAKKKKSDNDNLPESKSSKKGVFKKLKGKAKSKRQAMKERPHPAISKKERHRMKLERMKQQKESKMEEEEDKYEEEDSDDFSPEACEKPVASKFNALILSDSDSPPDIEDNNLEEEEIKEPVPEPEQEPIIDNPEIINRNKKEETKVVKKEHENKVSRRPKKFLLMAMFLLVIIIISTVFFIKF